MAIENSHRSLLLILTKRKSYIDAEKLIILTIMHSSIGRAGVQWNMPVLSYLEMDNDAENISENKTPTS